MHRQASDLSLPCWQIGASRTAKIAFAQAKLLLASLISLTKYFKVALM